MKRNSDIKQIHKKDEFKITISFATEGSDFQKIMEDILLQKYLKTYAK